ncbi:MAG: thioredoxin family protein [Candidatus Krumholzibacteriia bacterium]
MRRMPTTLLALTILVSLAGLAAAGDLVWRSHAEALPEAARTGKPVIIHFTADWCSWCTKMKKETYTDPAVARLMTEDFITAMVDSDDNPLLNWIYGVQSLPTIWIVDSDGQGITKIAGFRDARAFAKQLEWVASKAYLTQSFNAYANLGQ